MIASLCGEPWCLTPEEAGRVTLYQWRHVYGHPRGDNGELVFPPERPPDNWDVVQRQLWRKQGLPDWRIDEKLIEVQKALDLEGVVFIR